MANLTNLTNSLPPPQPLLEADFSRIIGRFRPLHGVNNGPLAWGSLTDTSPFHRELAPPYTRIHDPNWPNPDVVDINAVFPNFDADPAVAANYDFERSDEYIEAIVNTGAKVIYRLGHGIEHTRRKYHTAPPKDYDQWAAICVGIVRHYSAPPFNVRHWEIWNEPDLTSGSTSSVSPTWGGTWEDYYRLYTVAAKAIKAHDPTNNVGGPAMTGGGVANRFLSGFLAYCREHNAPLDFCSWHHYTSEPREIVDLSAQVRRLLDEYGYNQALSVLDEWNYIPPGMDWSVLFGAAYPREQRRLAQTIAGPTGAAYDAATLLFMQDCPIDIATFYLADALPYFSLFDVYGVPLKAFYAFRAFRRLLDTPQRAFTAGSDVNAGLVIGAGLADGADQATLLISNLKADTDNVRVAVRNLPWEGARCEKFVLDAEHDLEPVKTEWFNARSFEIVERVPASSVCLITLSPET